MYICDCSLPSLALEHSWEKEDSFVDRKYIYFSFNLHAIEFHNKLMSKKPPE